MPTSEYLITSDTLTNIADAIRSKTGGSSPIAVDDFASDIGDIQTGYTTTINGRTVERDLNLQSTYIPDITSLYNDLSGINKGNMGCCHQGGIYYVGVVSSDGSDYKIMKYEPSNYAWKTHITKSQLETAGANFEFSNVKYIRCYSLWSSLIIELHDAGFGCAVYEVSSPYSPTVIMNTQYSGGGFIDNDSIHGCISIGASVDSTSGSSNVMAVYALVSDAIDYGTKSHLYKIDSDGVVTGPIITINQGENLLSGVDADAPYLFARNSNGTYGITFWYGGYRYSAYGASGSVTLNSEAETYLTGSYILPIYWYTSGNNIVVFNKQLNGYDTDMYLLAYDSVSNPTYSIDIDSGTKEISTDNYYVICESSGYNKPSFYDYFTDSFETAFKKFERFDISDLSRCTTARAETKVYKEV